jgi:hypothetical protein
MYSRVLLNEVSMTSPRLWKTWKVSESLLRRAKTSLPAPPIDAKVDFDRLEESFQEFLERNEHELAMDMLEEMGKICLPRGGFWKDMERVALNMGLENRVAALRSEFDKALDRRGTQSGDAT